MKTIPTPPATLLERVLSPWPFLAGAVFSFLACCVLGRLVGNTNSLGALPRFHREASVDTQFFPTASQVVTMSRARRQPGKVTVIVGGNSILYGTGQSPSEVWTHCLQEKLGDDFTVINLAMRGSHNSEFGAVVAEILAQEDPHLIYIGVLGPCGGIVVHPFDTTYSYFFWDAYTKGMLPEDPERDAAVAKFRRTAYEVEETKPALADRDRRFQVDRYLRAQDFWNFHSYCRFSTIYDPCLSKNFLRARRNFPDVEPSAVPLEQRYPPHQHAVEMGIVQGAARAVDNSEAMGNACRDAFPASMRPRTLLILARDSPFYVEQLAPEEYEHYQDYYPATMRELHKHGYAVHPMSLSFTAADFADRCHLAGPGGKKLAHEVAPEVRALALKLGYLSEGEER